MDKSDELARQLFEQEHPGRRWDPDLGGEEADADTGVDHASEDERAAYARRALKELEAGIIR